MSYRLSSQLKTITSPDRAPKAKKRSRRRQKNNNNSLNNMEVDESGDETEQRFQTGDKIYFYDNGKKFTGENTGKSVLPGEVLYSFYNYKKKKQFVRIQYHYQKVKGKGAWFKYPTRSDWPLDVPMDSDQIVRRPPGNDKDIMLHHQIFGKQFLRESCWYKRHKLVEIVLEKQRKRKEEVEKKKNEAQRNQDLLNAKKQKEERILELLTQIESASKETNALMNDSEEVQNLPPCMILSKELWREATKNKDNTIPSDRIGGYGRATLFQRTFLRKLTDVSKQHGQLLSTGFTLHKHMHRTAVSMIKNNDVPKKYDMDEWINLSKDQLINQPFTEFMKAMTSPKQTPKAIDQFARNMFMVVCLALSMSGNVFRHPVETLLTQQLLKGGMERLHTSALTKTMSFGVTPRLADTAMAATGFTKLAKSFNLSLEYEVSRFMCLFGIIKILTDNFGQKVGGGSYMTGCTVIIRGVDKDLNGHQECVEFVATCNKKEVPIENSGLETVNDLGSTATVDAFCSTFILFNIIHVASLRGIIIAARGNGRRRGDLKTYAQERNSKWSDNQKHRASKHITGGEDGRKQIHEPSLFYNEAEVDNSDQHGGNIWDRMGRNPEWGFDGFGKIVQDRNLNKFSQIFYRDENGTKVRINPDPTLKIQ